MMIRYFVDKLPDTCATCKKSKTMKLCDNEYATGSNLYCDITKQSLYLDDFNVRRPTHCPLEIMFEEKE